MDEVKETDKAIKKFIDSHGQFARIHYIRGGNEPDENTQPEKPKENVNTSNWVYGFLGD